MSFLTAKQIVRENKYGILIGVKGAVLHCRLSRLSVWISARGQGCRQFDVLSACRYVIIMVTVFTFVTAVFLVRLRKLWVDLGTLR